MNEITKALKQLKSYNGRLTYQQFKTLRGQILTGDIDGAMKGLQTIIEQKEKTNAE